MQEKPLTRISTVTITSWKRPKQTARKTCGGTPSLGVLAQSKIRHGRVAAKGGSTISAETSTHLSVASACHARHPYRFPNQTVSRNQLHRKEALRNAADDSPHNNAVETPGGRKPRKSISQLQTTFCHVAWRLMVTGRLEPVKV